MGSIEETTTVFGTFTLPVDDGEAAPDPVDRNFYAPPKPKEMVQRSYPLIDFRKHVFPVHADESERLSAAAAFLSQKGFTAVKSRCGIQNADDPEEIKNSFYPEAVRIVKSLTNCQNVLPTMSLRRGPATNAFPSGVAKDEESRIKAGNGTSASGKNSKSIHIETVGRPVRVPHIDYTPLGMRRAIRNYFQDGKELAANVIAHEDFIVNGEGAIATDKAEHSTQFMFDNYNKPHPGPRYAAFSIWRPLNTATRDPLTMCPRKDIATATDLVMWPYENRNPGFEGDWYNQLEMLRVQTKKEETRCGPGNTLDHAPRHSTPGFHYIPNQEPDEVLVVKLFDSASLGEGSEEAPGCYHASPDLGAAAHGDERDSVEVRVYAFW